MVKAGRSSRLEAEERTDLPPATVADGVTHPCITVANSSFLRGHAIGTRFPTGHADSFSGGAVCYRWQHRLPRDHLFLRTTGYNGHGTSMTTLTVDAHREKMTRALEQNQHYEFLMLAGPYLTACPEDQYIRLMSVRSYLSLGLVVPARHELDAGAACGALSPELESLRPQLASIHASPMDWDDFAPQFQANLAALEDRGVDTGPIRESWHLHRSRYLLYRDSNDVTQVHRQDADGRWGWFPSLRDHPQATAQEPLPESLNDNMPQPLLFDGVGQGRLFERVYHTTLDTLVSYSCALLVVEPDAADLAVALHLRDWKDLLADRRVFLFVGDDWLDRLERHWVAEPNVPLPIHALRIGPRSQSAASSTLVSRIEQAHRDREGRIRKSWSQIEAIYANQTQADLARRFREAMNGTGPPLRVLAATSTHTTFLQHSMRDAQHALTSLGVECRVLKEETYYDVLSPLVYHDAIREFKPDLFFVLDHLRSSFSGTLPTNLPLLTWDQDQLPHVLTAANIAQIEKHDFVAGYSKSRCVELGANPKQLLYAGIPTCPDQFGGDPLTDKERAAYTCDISYVSHASQTAEAFHHEERAGYKDATLVRLLDTLYELLPPLLSKYQTAHGAVIQTTLEEGMRRCAISELPADLHTRLTSWYLWRLGDRIFRHEALEWAAQWANASGRTLRIYGNGWDRHPTLSEFAAGPAGNGRELVCIYRASKINLQLMPAGFIHQRALDGLAAGGFFLTRMTPHDMKGRLLRRIMQRMDELGVGSAEELLNAQDEVLTTSLHELFGDHYDRLAENQPHLIENLRTAAEVRYPDEVFEDFEQIGFDSRESFEAAANAFLADAPRRENIAASMRGAVIEHFSYRTTMKRFLDAMTAYFQEMTQ